MRRPRSTRAIVMVVAILTMSACGGAEPAPSRTPSPTVPPIAPTTAPAAPATPASPTVPASPSAPASIEVTVFFPNEGMGDPCEDVFEVPRRVPAATPLRGALEALLAGPTAAEREQGYGGWFSADTADLLDGVRLEQPVAHVSFDASLPDVIPNASTSCGSAILLAQLDRTTTQFPVVADGRYSLEGDEAAFYNWLQRDVP